MVRGRRIVAGAAVAGFLLAPPAGAQQPRAVRISTDNDAFIFWRPPWQRTDHEYTGGARGTLVYAGRAPLMPRRLVGRVDAGAPSAGVSHSYSLGQQLYTGEPPVSPGVAPAKHPSQRTNAAWLYLEAAERDSTAVGVTDYTIRLGVVGPPALGGPTQDFFHVIGPKYPLPVDWREQLPFEPGFVLTATRTRVVASRGGGARAAVDVALRGSASLGTILTGVEGGIGATASTQLGSGSDDNLWPRVVVAVGTNVHAVGRDEFLDGTFFRPSPRLARKAVYADGSATLALRWRRLGVLYRVTRTGEQYRLQQAPTLWGTLAAEWTP